MSISTGDVITADQIVLATGARPSIPDAIAAAGVSFHTSDTVMRIDQLPSRLIIVGGGYIAAEFAHVFSAFGVEVILINRSTQLLRVADSEISHRFTAIAAGQWDLRLGVEVSAATEQDGQITLSLSDGTSVSGDCLLVATGRIPNSDRMKLEAGGVDVLADGRIKVDEYGRTTATGVWSLGDVSSEYQLKHVRQRRGSLCRAQPQPSRSAAPVQRALGAVRGLHLAAARQRRPDRG